MSKKDKKACGIKTSIGGQALIEGIMMRGPRRSAMAVRNPDGEIVLEEWATEQSTKKGFTKLPFVRGIFNFIDSMKAGYKCLMRSAEISGLEELEAEIEKEKQEKKLAKKAKKEGKTADEIKAEADIEFTEKKEESIEEDAPSEPATAEISDEASTKSEIKEKKENKTGSSLTTGVMIISTLLGVVLAVGLFVFLPSFFAKLIADAVNATDTARSVLIASVSGVIKVIILIIYMAAVSLMKDIKRTFMYHGAEHKTIFCYEQGLELTVENVRKQRRFHPRCGTSFLILMVLVSIVIMIPIGAVLEFLPDPIINNQILYTLIRTGCAIILLPLIMGVGYELIRVAGKHDNIVTRIISAPGMWLQRITTKEPDDGMIECAIEAMKKVIPEDNSDKI